MQSRLRRRLRRSFQFERAELVLGLGEYEERFRANKIDADVFADLADGDLEKLGLPLGDRKRFLKAVAALAGLATRLEPTQAQPPGSTAAQSTSAERHPIITAEAFYRQHGYEVRERSEHILDNGQSMARVKMRKSLLRNLELCVAL